MATGNYLPTNSAQGVLISPHPLQHLLFSVLLIETILMDVGVFPIVVLVCISLTISGVEFLFMYMLAIFKSFAHLKNHIV